MKGAANSRTQLKRFFCPAGTAVWIRLAASAPTRRESKLLVTSRSQRSASCASVPSKPGESRGSGSAVQADLQSEGPVGSEAWLRAPGVRRRTGRYLSNCGEREVQVFAGEQVFTWPYMKHEAGLCNSCAAELRVHPQISPVEKETHGQSFRKLLSNGGSPRTAAV